MMRRFLVALALTIALAAALLPGSASARAQDYYSSLLTVSDGIEIVAVSPLQPYDRDQTVMLDGPVWESSGRDPNAWMLHLYPPAPDSIRTSPAVPLPDVAPFLSPSGPLATAALAVRSGPGTSVTYTLDASGTPGVPAYFRAEDTDANFSFNSFPRPGCTIQVQGLAVWLLPRGAMFYMGTVITGDPSTDCLVVIAGPMMGHFGPSIATGPTSSICFLGKLQANIPVVLVSSGEVLLWQENDWSKSTSTNDLAIFARSARFMGPSAVANPSAVLQLRRDPNGPLNTFFLNALAAQGALPSAGGTPVPAKSTSWGRIKALYR